MPSSIGPIVVVPINLDNLSAGTVAASTVIDNTQNQFDSIQCYLTLKPGTLRSGGYFLVGLMASADNVNFTNFSASEVKINAEDSHLQTDVSAVHYLVLNNLPLYYKIYVHNRAGGPLSAIAGSNTLSYCGVKN